MAELGAAFVSGLLFALGLVCGDATNPARVVGFLDVFGNWDATLMFVMGGALSVAAVGYRFIKHRTRPLFAANFAMPLRTVVDAPLVIGSVLFGVGWGVGGYCPGPAVAFISAFSAPATIFAVSMLVGMGIHAAFLADRPDEDDIDG